MPDIYGFEIWHIVPATIWLFFAVRLAWSRVQPLMEELL